MTRKKDLGWVKTVRLALSHPSLSDFVLTTCLLDWKLRNILTIDVEDYFQASAFDRIIGRGDWDRFESRVAANTEIILELMAAESVTATFFVLGWVAERFPGLVARIHSQGHEIACHGYSHKLIYQQTRQEFAEETRRAKSVLENIIGRPVVSYRAASYSVTRKSQWALQILAEEGFQYDSSIFPIVHDRYGVPGAPRCPFRLKLEGKKELFEFPISTVRILGINFPMGGGGYFRLLPYVATHKAICRLNSRDGLPLIFYLHPWEFDPEQPRLRVGRSTRFRHYLNLKHTRDRFQSLLQDFEFGSLAEIASTIRFPTLSLDEVMKGSQGKSAEIDSARKNE